MEEVAVQNQSAPYYEIRYQGWGKRYHTAIIRQLLHDARGKVLDVGCGTGFAQVVRPDLDMVGIDLSPAMLTRHPGRHELMDVCAMRFPTHSFDFILCRSLLHHLPDHRKGLREMSRVLRPGGALAFLETNKSLLATWIRRWTQHGDRFSSYHQSFHAKALQEDIARYFHIDHVAYLGFVAYPLFGFRDIVDLSGLVPLKSVVYPWMMALDTGLSRIPWLRQWSWALLIRASKP